ncbi:hypothetical protein Sjap_020101 [Stephania japonica]|uniref:Uncharacterized protein n=1 Tax=Stephania japonica TaxID=461633 RepID=A0AAP0F2V7_9MAGN
MGLAVGISATQRERSYHVVEASENTVGHKKHANRKTSKTKSPEVSPRGSTPTIKSNGRRDNKKQKIASGSSSVTPELIIEDSAPTPLTRLQHESSFIPSWGVKNCDFVLANTSTARELILKGMTPADRHAASSLTPHVIANRAYQNMATSQLCNSEAIEKMLTLAEENEKLEVTLLEKDKVINMKDGAHSP